jgi:FdhD protein
MDASPRPGTAAGSAEYRLERHAGRLGLPETDLLVVEEPLEIRYAHAAVATLMRTPGDDLELALGYLYSEGWIDGPSDIGAVALCSGLRPRADGSAAEGENIVDFLPAAGRGPPPGLAARSAPASSSCGVCGKRTIAEAMALRPPAGAGPAGRGRWLAPELLCSLPDELRRRQRLFASTGALHAAGLFTPAGEALAVREDIGRHNAVDKVIGAALRAGELPLGGRILQVSGRVSFEIVQKAYRAGIGAVTAVSGVSSLAVDLARGVEMTLIGFAREGGFCVYAGAERLGD